MKTTKTNKLIAVLIMTIIISICNTVLAQIKIAGDDYSQKLTESKDYYNQEIDFDKYFPAVSPKERFSIMYPDFTYNSNVEKVKGNRFVNLTGDTIFICRNIACNNDYSFSMINNKGEDDSGCCYSIWIPSGYYVISGYVFCSENADLVRREAGLGYKKYYNTDKPDTKKLKEQILMDAINTEKLLYSFQQYIVLTPLNNDSTVYYLNPNSISNTDEKEMLLLRYYNQATDFIGKKVVLKRYKYDYDNRKEELVNLSETIRDGISGDVVKIEDDYYEVVDVVLKDCRFYLVLKGEKAGSFALETACVYYAYSSNDLMKVAHRGEIYWYVKEYDNTRDIPVFNVHKYNNYSDIILVVEENDWLTLEQRAKLTKEQKEKEKNLRQQQEKQEKANREAAHKQQMLAKYGSQFGELVANKQVALGMTKDMCRDAWGNPMNIYRTTTSFGQSEVWCYNYKTMIYFFEGTVVQIDD